MEKNDKKLIVNALVVTKDDENRIFRNGFISIEGNTIKAIGPADRLDLGKYAPARGHRRLSKIVAPGFVSPQSPL